MESSENLSHMCVSIDLNFKSVHSHSYEHIHTFHRYECFEKNPVVTQILLI